MLGPLAGLLLLSRPATLWERFTFVLAAAVTGAWLAAPGDLAGAFERAGVVLVVGAFLAFTVRRPASPVFARAAGAIGAAVLALAVWCAVFRVGPVQLRDAVVQHEWREHRAEAAQVTEVVSTGLLTESQAGDLVEQMRRQTEATLPVLPALWFLALLLGIEVASAWYHRIAARPLDSAPGRLAAFRFSDQLVWVVVAGVAALLVPGQPVLDAVGANLLVVAGALYAVRGVAVFLAAAAGTPRPVVATVGVASLFLFPFAAGGLTLLGLVDTWLDFRRRLASSPTGGTDR